MIFTSWNFKQRVASWFSQVEILNNELQVELLNNELQVIFVKTTSCKLIWNFFLKMNNCPNIIWLTKGRCIQFQVNQVSLVFQWLKIKGFLKWLLPFSRFSKMILLSCCCIFWLLTVKMLLLKEDFILSTNGTRLKKYLRWYLRMKIETTWLSEQHGYTVTRAG